MAHNIINFKILKREWGIEGEVATKKKNSYLTWAQPKHHHTHEKAFFLFSFNVPMFTLLLSVCVLYGNSGLESNGFFSSKMKPLNSILAELMMNLWNLYRNFTTDGCSRHCNVSQMLLLLPLPYIHIIRYLIFALLKYLSIIIIKWYVSVVVIVVVSSLIIPNRICLWWWRRTKTSSSSTSYGIRYSLHTENGKLTNNIEGVAVCSMQFSRNFPWKSNVGIF